MERFADDDDDELDLETRMEREAAAEARALGGEPEPEALPGTGEQVSDAMRPVYEAGGGEAEGFELAEYDLERNAAHDDGEGLPEADRFTEELESDRSTAEYGEADEEEDEDW